MTGRGRRAAAPLVVSAGRVAAAACAARLAAGAAGRRHAARRGAAATGGARARSAGARAPAGRALAARRVRLVLLLARTRPAGRSRHGEAGVSRRRRAAPTAAARGGDRDDQDQEQQPQDGRGRRSPAPEHGLVTDVCPFHDARKVARGAAAGSRSEEHTSELQSQSNLVCRLLLEKKKKTTNKLRV